MDVRLSVEFMDRGRQETALISGNSEVFRHKSSKVAPPWVERRLWSTRTGNHADRLWLHDTVDGNFIRVHYFAQKPERDTSRILSQRRRACR